MPPSPPPSSRLFASEPTHARVFCPSSFFRSSRLTSAAYFRTRYALTFAKTAFIQFTDKLFDVRRRKGGEEGEEGENGRRGQLSQTCSRNNRWLLNRKHTRFLWGRRYRYENALAFRKRTTCLVSSVSFVSRFLPVNKPGLHPPAAARHPPSKHKARWLVVSRCRKAWRYSFAVSPFLSFSHFLSLSFFRSCYSHTILSFARDDRIICFDLRRHSLLAVFFEYTLHLAFYTKKASCIFSEICRAVIIWILRKMRYKKYLCNRQIYNKIVILFRC